MAKETLGRNITFPIYNENGTPFHNLALEKAVVDSVVMSLGDKITGDVYYRDNTLDVTMREYIIYKKDPQNENEDAVKYVLVNPPTIVREGLVSDNSELKGMTKYSFVFYHPMYILNNIPFTDVAVSFDEERYKSQDRSFSWIGYLDDYVNKLNKNLDGTEWIVVSNATDANTVLSDVLTFDNSTIAEALKKAYETWGTPFIIDKIDEGEEHYSEGKRFSVLIGTPSNTIKRDGNEYIFRFGQGLGLKNNSATPRNNKIITRIAGYGSEDNIPYGYPQIVWTGDSRWEYTAYVNNDPEIDEDGDGKPHGTPAVGAYPLYMGIVGGAYVKLIKHPFTRTHLMPSVYCETVDMKVNPLNPNYNPQTTIIDYYDALDNTYRDSQNEFISFPNNIDLQKPSYEIHQFDGIKPELGNAYLVANAIPVNSDQSPASGWDDSMDGDGNYNQSYFKIILPVLNFDLYACAAITQEMKIAMRGGACIGCTFTVQVNWESYKANFYDANGNFAPDGTQRNYEYFPDTTHNEVAIIVQKDLDTFGTIMPNVYQQPHEGDTFVFLGISLPLNYITNAQERLDNEMVSYMRENNIYYFDYPLKFDEYFLAKNTDILLQIRNNSAIKFQFAETTHTLYVKQITIKYGNGTLPQYDITLTDKIEAEINKIGQMIDESVNRITTVQATFVDVPYTLTQSVRSKMSADWFQRLFVAYDANNNIVSPNDTQTEIARICALYDFYSVGGVSSLGVGSSSGGGASSLAELSDVNISSPIDGQGLVYDSATQKWVNGTVGGGGGGGISLADVWTSLAADNTSNKIHFSHLPNTIHVVDALRVDRSGHLENYNGAIFDLPSHSYRSTPYTLATTEDIQNIDLTDYALRSWVEGKNYLTGNQTITLSGDVSGSGTTSISVQIGTGKVTNDMLYGNIANNKLSNNSITIAGETVTLGGSILASTLLTKVQSDFDGRYVTKGTEQEITASKTFKSTASLTVEASLTASNDIYLNKRYQQQWVNFDNKTKNFSFGQEQGGDSVLYASGSVNFYTNINNNPYALFIQGSTGNVGIGKNNPTYKFDVNGNIHTNSAYYLDDRLFANNDTVNNSGLNIGYGYAVGNPEKNQSQLPMALWGNGISFRSAGGTYGGCTKIDDTHGNITYGIMATDFIGVTNKFRFEYDSDNNTVWVLKANGQPVHFASLGGVTSLGVGASGTPNISSMNIATLMTTNTTVGNQLNIGTSGTNNGQINFYDADETGGASISVNSGDLHITSDSTTYIDSLLSVDGEVRGTSLHTSGGNLTMDGGKILMGGGRIYLDATRYLYLNGSSLMYYNGTSSINVA